MNRPRIHALPPLTAFSRRDVLHIILPGLLLLLAANGPAAPWTSWTKHPTNPVYTHSAVASDPSVIKDGSTYRMVVSGAGGGSPDGNSLILATSPDGTVWATLNNGQDGLVVPSALGVWDESLETPELIKAGGEYLLVYAGYDPAARDASGGLAWGDLGLAVSTDGAHFVRSSTSPVLTRTPNSFDQDGLTDPTIVDLGGTLEMIYVGWCTQGCALNGGQPAFYALKAVSTDNGRTWTKQGRLDPGSNIGLQHPDIVLDADGLYSLFYGVDDACGAGRVGLSLARGPAPFGPFTEVSANPVLCLGTQPFENAGMDGGFPSVLNDNGVGRLYYTGVNEALFEFRVGLAETRLTTPGGGEEPLGFPNPFKPSSGIPLTFARLAPGGRVRIFSLTGESVAEVSADGGGTAQWSGRNASGRTAASGIYWVLADGADGSRKTFKIVVRN